MSPIKTIVNKYYKVLLFTIILMFNSCRDYSTNPIPPNVNKVTINVEGGIYGGKAYRVETPMNNANGAEYDSLTNITRCSTFAPSRSDIPFGFEVIVTDTVIGKYQWQTCLNCNYILINMKPSSSKDMMYATDSGSTMITKYGKIGEMIEGNFSGKFNPYNTIDTVIISGDFMIQRKK